MLNPIRLCNDLFADKDFSDSNLRTFTEDHLLRVSNNNPGGSLYTSLIVDTTNKYNAYYGRMSSELIQNQIKEGLTIGKQNSRTAVETKMSSLQGLIKFKFGETSAAYQEFYPQGMEHFYKAKDGDLELLLDAFQTSAVTYLTADFPAEVTAFATLNTAYKTAYAAQNNAFSLIDNIITGKHSDRKALTAQLTFNFLIIASNNIDNPDQFDDYYNPAYLPISEGPETFNGIISANTIINAVPEGHITASSTLYVENKGNIPLTFSLTDNPDSISPKTQTTLNPGQHERFSGDLPTLTKYFVNIQNTSADENGSWHIEVS